MINILFMLPAFLFLFIVVIIPFFQGIPYSFTNWKSMLNSHRDFVGFKNYGLLLTDGHFLRTFQNTFSYTILYVCIANFLGLLFALLLQKSQVFNNFCRTIVFLPFTVSLVASAIVWNYVFSDIYSVLFDKINPFGLSGQVIYAMVIVGVWRDMGYCMLIFIAALTAIPQDYYEAALIEGASRRCQFFRITLPLIVPAFTANVTLLLSWGLRLFDLPMAVARNMEAAETTTMFIYNYIFCYSKTGYGQAAAIISTIVLLLLTQIVTHFFRKMEVEA
jgi:ABC-type sugar transport system permease subunit